MPRMILTFDLPEDKAEAEEAAHAGDVTAAIGDWLNWCRGVTKYGVADGPRGERDECGREDADGRDLVSNVVENASEERVGRLHGPTIDVARARLWAFLSDRGVDCESL